MTSLPSSRGLAPRPPSPAGGLDRYGGGVETDDAALGVALPLDVGPQLLDPDPAFGDGLDGLAAIRGYAVLLPLADRLGGDGAFTLDGQRLGEGPLAREGLDRRGKGFAGGGHRARLGKVAPYCKPALYVRQQGRVYRSSDTLPGMGNRVLKPDAAEFAQRLNEVLDGVPGAPAENRGAWLGRLYNVSKVTSGDWLRGKSMPEPFRVLHMADRWRVSFMWLYFGRGTMNNSQGSTDPAPEPGAVSLPVRLDTLTLALQLASEALERERPTPEQQARVAALCYGLVEKGMKRADLLQFARSAASLFPGGMDATAAGVDRGA